VLDIKIKHDITITVIIVTIKTVTVTVIKTIMDIKNYILLTISSRVISILDEYLKHNNDSMIYIIMAVFVAYGVHIIYNNMHPFKFMINRESSIIVSSKKG